ncbi:hypothetical protein BHU72_14600 [Desulfuribacillus stibiiarsenatis]|uniref:HTH luxR-type domain-containing protein n=1 Tax=Desulfuribacillus stibiiarsenatis TaxID=1390249 RepID=A0A1E5L7D2_9FIRM|nr:hypothetical protein [Desulfuribacillus stibiiarsenatis]OEH86057.1 hypothetical protein BHU72_14600 [Desulfuribacillus stibiiarsenatis]
MLNSINDLPERLVNEFLSEYKLTNTEREVAFHLLTANENAVGIAKMMHKSVKTLKNQISSIYITTNSKARSDFQAKYIEYLHKNIQELSSKQIFDIPSFRRRDGKQMRHAI